MCNDLDSMSISVKETFVTSCWEMIICDGRPNSKEIKYLSFNMDKMVFRRKHL
jgi:hypothetical protein